VRAEEPYALLERVFREEAGRLTATLVRLLGDFDLAEELVSEAVVEALTHWPRDGVPERPASWLLTTAKRKGLDRLRREKRYREKLALVAGLPTVPPPASDDRLQLILTCCHPVLSREAQIALTLRAVVGLTTKEIARAFMLSEEALAKRIVRAKQKIVASRIPYRVPSSDELGPRLNEVLSVIYLVFNEGHLSTSGSEPIRRDLARDAEWLAALLMSLVPHEPEVMALVALIRLHLARWPARLDSTGGLVLLAEQNRALWDQRAIAAAVHLIERAAAIGPPGPYLIEASISAIHCEAQTWAETDWAQIVALYDVLAQMDPSPVVRLNRAIALGYAQDPGQALREIESTEPRLSGYHLYHAARAVFLRELGRTAEADLADAEAVKLTSNPAERDLMTRRIATINELVAEPASASRARRHRAPEKARQRYEPSPKLSPLNPLDSTRNRS
jgi:RNA polymerase sigma-70 factor (ECF subfamily)